MKIAEKLVREDERLNYLHSFSILDTLEEAEYDNLTKIAAEICKTPISLITFLTEDRQWFKSHFGIDVKETPKEISFCSHAILDIDSPLVVNDARKDERFHDNPLVINDPYVIFYAGFPLVDSKGLPLGTFCVIDHKPKELSEGQLDSLKALANQAMNLLELRKNKLILEKVISELKENANNMERFAYIAAHDLKSPLRNISSLIRLFSKNYSAIIDEDGKKIIDIIINSSNSLKSLIEGLLEYSKSESISKHEKTDVEVEQIKNNLINLFPFEKRYKISIDSEIDKLFTNELALNQILTNLVDNAIKYNDKPIAEILININEENEKYIFKITDNGPGIDEKYQEKIFNIFETYSNTDKYGNKGNGIGLSTVKKMINSLNGDIHLESKVGEGTTFKFDILK